jgi:ribose 5-phosphate isomerase A
VAPAAGNDSPARAAAAQAALDWIEPGTTIGLGSGRTVWAVVDAMARRWPEGPPVRAVVASNRTESVARGARIEIAELGGDVRPALAVDGADEIDPELGLLKGGGGALLREKILVAAAGRFLVVAEEEKRVERLGRRWPLPVEVVRFGWETTRARLLELLGGAELRTSDSGDVVVTDEGHHLLDCPLPADGDLPALAEAVKAEVGVIEHGLFLGMAHAALLGRPDGSVATLER